MSQSFTGVDKLEMSVGSGDIILNKGNGNEVSFKLEHTFGEDYEPTIQQKGSKLVIKDPKGMRSYSGRATWEFIVPETFEIGINTGSGNIQISELMIDGGANTGSGNFDLVKLEGELSVNTGSGNIKGEDVKGKYNFNTGSGNVGLRNVMAQLNANTGSGNVDVRDLALTGPSNFNTGSGDAAVSLSATAEHNLSVNSGSGDASLDFGGNNVEGTLVMSINKNRGKIKAPFDFDETEEIGNGNSTTLKKTKKFTGKDVKIGVSSGSGTASFTE